MDASGGAGRSFSGQNEKNILSTSLLLLPEPHGLSCDPPLEQSTRGQPHSFGRRRGWVMFERTGVQSGVRSRVNL